MSKSNKFTQPSYLLTFGGLLIVAIILVFVVTGGVSNEDNDDIDMVNGLSGTIEIDGSSTVGPITIAVAEEFGKVNPNVRVNVGISGTGGGFKRFIVGDTIINDASRPIRDDERELAQNNGISYLELPIAIDGLAVVVNPENTWVDFLTVEELNKIWNPYSDVAKWNEIRSDWPNKKINLYGPGTDSGTFDYFTKIINGEEGASRADFTASEDDNVLVQGIQGDLNGLAYFGYAYYAENTDKLKIVPIDSGKGPVIPTSDTVPSGEYSPLSRPVFIYVNKDALDLPEVKEFIIFYMEHAIKLVTEVGYIPFESDTYTQNDSQVDS